MINGQVKCYVNGHPIENESDIEFHHIQPFSLELGHTFLSRGKSSLLATVVNPKESLVSYVIFTK